MVDSIITYLYTWVQSQEAVMLYRLFVATILGGVIGIERGSGDRPAGLRTHILVCVGSTLFMLVSIYGFDDGLPVNTAAGDLGTRRDTARIAAQVVSGIGFLGAGTILHEGLTIRGLTTAASLWISSAIGLAVGSGMIFLSVAATAITMVTLVSFHTWEKRFALKGRENRRFIRIVAVNSHEIITDITTFLNQQYAQVRSINVKKDKNKQLLNIDLFIKRGELSPADSEIVGGLQDIEGVLKVDSSK